MGPRLKAIAPLALSIGILAFVATWLALNFTFHWVTVHYGVFGKYGLPQNIHLALPAIFVGWGVYFLLGADSAALARARTISTRRRQTRSDHIPVKGVTAITTTAATVDSHKASRSDKDPADVRNAGT